MTIRDEFRSLVEQVVKDELFIRPNQRLSDVAYAITREIERRMTEHHLKVIDSRPFFVESDDNGDHRC